MQNKTYDKLKWFSMVVLPALGTMVVTLGVAFNWGYTDLAVTFVTTIGVFLGSILGVSNKNYNMKGGE